MPIVFTVVRPAVTVTRRRPVWTFSLWARSSIWQRSSDTSGGPPGALADDPRGTVTVNFVELRGSVLRLRRQIAPACCLLYRRVNWATAHALSLLECGARVEVQASDEEEC